MNDVLSRTTQVRRSSVAATSPLAPPEISVPELTQPSPSGSGNRRCEGVLRAIRRTDIATIQPGRAVMRCASGGEQTPDAIVALMAGRAISGAAVHPASVGPAGDAVCASPAGAIARAVWERACRGQRSPRAPRNQFRCTPRIRPVRHRGGPTEVCCRVSAAARDRALSERLVAGDEQALRDAYREFSPAVLGLATRVIANESIAEEVLQEVFVRLWEQPERFDPTRGPLRAYLLAMTHSRAVERVRSEESLRRRHELAQREALREPPVESPERVLVDKDVSAAIRSALADAPREPACADRDGVLRGHVVPTGRGRPRRAGRNREVPHPRRHAEAAHRVAVR